MFALLAAALTLTAPTAQAGALSATTDAVGLDLLDTTPSLQAYLYIPDGVLIREVTPDSPAARAGLARGDVILQLDERDVRNTRRFSWAMAVRRGKALDLVVARDGEARSATVKVPRRPRRFLRSQEPDVDRMAHQDPPVETREVAALEARIAELEALIASE